MNQSPDKQHERIVQMANEVLNEQTSPTAYERAFAAEILRLETARPSLATPTYRERIHAFMLACFGEEIARDIVERNHRFLEESLELVQSTGCAASEAHQLVDYVFGRPVGEPHQECGGVVVTLAALCNAAGIDMEKAGEDELHRVNSKIDVIRAKQAGKPKHSPLPETARSPLAAPDAIPNDELDEILTDLRSAYEAIASVAMMIPSAHPVVAPRQKLPDVIGMVFEQAKAQLSHIGETSGKESSVGSTQEASAAASVSGTLGRSARMEDSEDMGKAARILAGGLAGPLPAEAAAVASSLSSTGTHELAGRLRYKADERGWPDNELLREAADELERLSAIGQKDE